MDLSIVIPTYNEKENIKILIQKIQIEFKDNSIKGEIIVVDDNSPDGTGRILEDLKKKYNNFKIIHRKGKLGLSSAVLEGWGIAKGRVLGVMDADLSHPPDKIHELYNLIKNNQADFTIGSRYVKYGKIEGWDLKRKIMSRVATIFAKPFTNVKDPMTGFFMIKRECIKDREINPKGFKILLELILKADYKKIREIPIKFTNRVKGKSKAGASEIFLYLRNLIGYRRYIRRGIKEFFKFAFVGLIGTFINIIILYLLTECFGIYYLFSAVISFIVAMTNNFVWNKIWTFGEKINLNLKQKYLKFSLVSITALMINLFFLYVFTDIFGIYYIISQILAIGISLIINFFGNKFWTFKK